MCGADKSGLQAENFYLRAVFKKTAENLLKTACGTGGFEVFYKYNGKIYCPYPLRVKNN